MLFKNIKTEDPNKIYTVSEFLKELEQKSNEVTRLEKKLRSQDKIIAKEFKIEIENFITKEAKITKRSALIARLSLLVLIISILISKFYSENVAIATLAIVAPIAISVIILTFKSESNMLNKSEEYNTKLTHLKKRAA